MVKLWPQSWRRLFLSRISFSLNVAVYARRVRVPGGSKFHLALGTIGPPHTPESLTHIDCYMDDVILVVQGGPDRQHQVFDGTDRALKWIFLSLPGELKDSVSVKKLVAGEGGWTCVKEVLGWILNTEAGTVTLPERKLEEILTLVDILPTQRRMG